MKKEINKYQVQWHDKDKKGEEYITFILAKDEKEAKVYAETARINRAWKIQVFQV